MMSLETGIHDLENANPDRVTEDVYDLNGNGSTTDKIPYAQSNYTNCCG